MQVDPEKLQAAASEEAGETKRQEEEIEVEHYDDAVIGRALKWSAVALAVIVGVGLGVVVWLKRPQEAAPVQVTELRAPVSRPAGPLTIPSVTFTDITTEAGIDFVHFNGAEGEKLLPESMGAGVAFIDFDADGDQDLLFVNGASWPGGNQPEGKQPTMELYANDGQGRFTRVTAGSGLDIPVYGMGVAIGDYDNDGLPDIYVTAVGENKLFHNLGGGRFEDVTAITRTGGAADGWSTSAGWLDYDNDGDLDLFVCNYVKWSRDIDFEVGYTLVGIGRAYGPPMNFEGTFPYLFRNDGSGKFADVSEAAGVQVRNKSTGVPAAKSLGLAPVDVDGDGYVDVIVANDTVPNFLFHNQADGTFKEVGAVAGIAFDSYGAARGAMGIDTGYYRNDQRLGIGIANFANEMNALFVSQNTPLHFADEAIPEGIGPASRLLLKFGFFFFDYDLDQRLDILTANGHLEEEITQVQASQKYAQPAQLYWNTGSLDLAGFVPVLPEQAGQDLFKPIVGRGSAYGDLDGDGDLDVVMTQVGGPPLVLRNEQSLGHQWIRLQLVGTKNNRSGIGSWIRVSLGDQVLSRQIMPTRSYLSQSELPVTIGLGQQEEVGSVEVIWPDGSRQMVESLRLGEVNVIEEAAGQAGQ